MSTAHVAAIGAPKGRVPALRVVSLAALLTAAGSIHLALTPTHFRESTLFGSVFLGIAITQFVVAYLLLLAPGVRAYRVALWTSVVIAATWMVTRLIPPPGGQAAEPVEIWGVVATAEIAAIIGIATMTVLGSSRWRRRRSPSPCAAARRWLRSPPAPG